LWFLGKTLASKRPISALFIYFRYLLRQLADKMQKIHKTRKQAHNA